MVGLAGFEPTTSSSRTKRATANLPTGCWQIVFATNCPDAVWATENRERSLGLTSPPILNSQFNSFAQKSHFSVPQFFCLPQALRSSASRPEFLFAGPFEELGFEQFLRGQVEVGLTGMDIGILGQGEGEGFL